MPLSQPGGFFRFEDTANIIGNGSGADQAGNANFMAGVGSGLRNLGDGSIFLGNSVGVDNNPDNRIIIGFEAGPLDASQVHAGNQGGVFIGTRAARNMDNAATVGDGVSVVIGFEAAEFQGGTFRNCVAIGKRAMRGTLANVTASSQQSVVIGTEACELVEQGANNSVCIGYRANRGSGALPTANSTVAIGDRCLENNRTGFQNVALGGNVLRNAQFATGNVAIGLNAMLNATSASQNICIGVQAGSGLSTGTLNILMGDDLLGANANENIMLSPDGVGPGNNNCVILGYRIQAGAYTQGAFDISSVQSAGVNRRSFLFGDMANGNLIIGNSTSVAGAATNRDFGGGANTLKLLDVAAPNYGNTGPPTANPVGGSFQWFDSAAGVGAVGAHQWRMPSGVIVTLGDAPSITGSRAANAALASLLTALATSGVITDNTVV